LGDRRLTVRELVEVLRSRGQATKTVLVDADDRLAFERLSAVLRALRQSVAEDVVIRFASPKLAARPCDYREAHDNLAAFRRLFENGGIDIDLGGGVLEIDPDTAGDPDSRPLHFSIRRRFGTETHWRLGTQPIEAKNDEARFQAFKKALEGERGNAAHLVLDIDRSVPVGLLMRLVVAAAELGFEDRRFTVANPDFRYFSSGLRHSLPGWLATEIENGLEALSRSQGPAGNWSGDDEPDGLNEVGRTALALLAFTGEFHSPDDGKHAKSVKAGLDWLLSRQKPTGAFESRFGAHFDYNQAIAAYALSEAYGLTVDDQWGDAADRALRFVLGARNAQGTWGVTADGRADLSVTAWSVMALRSGSTSGIDVDEDAIVAPLKWLASLTDDQGHVKGLDRGKPATTVRGFADDFFGRHPESLTAMGAIIKSRAGQLLQEDPILLQSTLRMVEQFPGAPAEIGECDLEYLFFGAAAMTDVGGPHWQGWSEGLEGVVFDRLGRLRGGRALARGAAELSKADPARVALLTLCLEYSYKYSRSVEAPK
ncbi:MAG: terpene cyclase/mutase family protein, partial [Planctomycetes bacterium]|nr:terpene cyclase/mutase family protein [Planctomycetota bacterium]